ncbi:MAG: hypothetical protein IKQ35_00680 [Bacilli bacterium]|nr:hypothetical protein [Bacilli bacterium]
MEEKSKNKGLIIALIIFIVISLGLAGYICFDKFIKSNEKNTNLDNSNVENNSNKKNVNKDSKNVQVNLTSEQAFKLIESKRKELKEDTWSTLNANVIKKGDNNYYWVAYTEINQYGYSPLAVIFHYENGEWEFSLPGFSGITEDDIKKYNFVDVNSSEYFELNNDLAYTLIEGKRKALGYNTWVTGSTKVIKKGDNNYYLVSYTEKNNDGYDSSLSVIFHYVKGEWEFSIPGFSGITEDDLKKYNFVDIE